MVCGVAEILPVNDALKLLDQVSFEHFSGRLHIHQRLGAKVPEFSPCLARAYCNHSLGYSSSCTSHSAQTQHKAWWWHRPAISNSLRLTANWLEEDFVRITQ